MIGFRNKSAGVWVIALVAMIPMVAQADDTANKAAAQALYDEAVKLMDGGQYPEACNKLEDANRLFLGIGTQARLGECYSKAARLASAWTTYRSALSMAESKGDSRVNELRARVASLEPRLSHLKIVVPEASRVPGLKVLRDGSNVPEGLWGVSIPVDGGVHTIESSAPGKITWTSTVTIQPEKGESVVNVGPLSSSTTPALPQASTTPTASSSVQTIPSAVTAEPRAPSPQSSRRTIAVVVGGIGLASLGVSGFFGWQTLSKKNASNADGHCNASNVCDDTGVSLRRDAQSSATISTVFFGIGAAAISGAAVLYLTAPTNHASQNAAPIGRVGITAQVDQRSGGVNVVGSW